MPELPEVETVRQILKKQIVNKIIINVEILYQGIIENVSKEEFKQKLFGEKIVDILRYGKYLIFILEKHSIISHLRMEGKFFIKDKNEILDKHEHVVFTFSDNSTLRYHDTRKFGKMALLNTTDLLEIMKYPSLSKLGLEANDPKLDGEYIYNKIKNKKLPIKTVLLDQTVIAGLGNIYADEVIHLCKIHPTTLACSLTLIDCNNIVDASSTTLKKAILEGGTTIRSYTSSLGVTGRFQQHLLVHTKDVCATCGKKVIKIRVGGRGTYFCPKCQGTNKKVIGITGVIGSGKSTISKYLIENGYKVIDSDTIVKKLYETKGLKEKIKLAFGNDFICNNEVDKFKLSNLIFSNKEKRNELNAIIHPLVKKSIKDSISKVNDNLIFIDVPLLYEAKFNDLCDFVIVVYTNELKNLSRLMKRNNITKEEALVKINSQMSIINKCYLADFIIDNSFDLCYTYKRLNEIIDLLK